jgi:hypothetical protein
MELLVLSCLLCSPPTTWNLLSPNEVEIETYGYAASYVAFWSQNPPDLGGTDN